MGVLLRVVLWAYPRDFRRDYGAEWTRTITDLRVHGGLSRPRLAFRVVIDALSTAPRMRLETLVQNRKAILSYWYLWIAAAAVLFMIGLGALVVMGDGQTATGEEDTGLVNGLAWLGWILSWGAAVISAGWGAVLAGRAFHGRKQLA